MFKKGSKERELLENRVKMCCASQSRQIDKTKIGQAVKDIPSIWKQFQKIEDSDSIESRNKKTFYNNILADKKPYFFKYKYDFLSKEYNEYLKRANDNCNTRFKISLEELQKRDINDLTEGQKIFIEYFNRFLPVIDSECVMNRICKYIENVDFKIKQKIRSSDSFDYSLLQSANFSINKKMYEKIKKIIEDTFKEWDLEKREKSKNRGNEKNPKKDSAYKFDKEAKISILKQRLEDICSNEEQLTNHLIYLFYIDKPSYSKGTLWNMVGKQIYDNIKNRTTSFYFPIRNQNGNLKFLYKNYSIERILLEND